MNISKLALIALLGSALTAFGCSSDSDGGGGAGGGAGGAGGAIDPMCQPVAGECMGGELDSVALCDACDIPDPPDPADACTGSESTDNPASCETGGSTITYRLTQMDGCDGETCKASEATLTSPDGANGVDNSLSSLTPVLPTFQTSLTGVEQAFYDSLCGLTNDDTMGVCQGGTAEPDTACTDDAGCPDGAGMVCNSAGNECTTNADCTAPDTCVADAGTCNLDNDDCQQEITQAVITFEVDVNPDAGCATVVVRTEGVEGMTTSFVNLSAANGDGNFCMSGKLEAISMPLLDFDGALGNPSVRATLSEDGLSHGVLGATVDSETAEAIAAAISPIAVAIVGATFDISSTLTQDTSAACDALSMTLEIGGVTVTTN
ncbi:MAG: hypothetical protein JRJ24_09345 [Deltaproteobacteria bacterium]|nr:hypothetical protein [Deltaproteobacteria bacterium]